jgi:hypothetical protein
VRVAPRKFRSQGDSPQSHELAYLNERIPIKAVYTALSGLAVEGHWAKCPLAANHDESTLRFLANRAECIDEQCNASFSAIDLALTMRHCDLQSAVHWIRAKWPEPMPVDECVDDSEDDDDPIAADAPRPLVPPGEYNLLCTRTIRQRFPGFHRHGIVLTLQICDELHIGTFIERYFNIPEDGKIRRGGHYYAEWIIANGGVLPHRRDKMAKKKFLGKMFRGRVVTVTTNSNKMDLGAAAYSKVERLFALVATNE